LDAADLVMMMLRKPVGCWVMSLETVGGCSAGSIAYSGRVGREPHWNGTWVGGVRGWLNYSTTLDGFFSHAQTEALLQTTVLTLIAMMLVNRTVMIAPAGVCQICSDRSLKEALTSLTGKLSIVLPRAPISTHHTLDISTPVMFIVGPRGAGIVVVIRRVGRVDAG